MGRGTYLNTSFLTVLTVLAVGCGGDPTCQELTASVEEAVAGFAPTASNGCSSDSDCQAVSSSISYQGQRCYGACPTVMGNDRATEYQEFLASDEAVQGPCGEIVNRGCGVSTPTCESLTARCISNVCTGV